MWDGDIRSDSTATFFELLPKKEATFLFHINAVSNVTGSLILLYKFFNDAKENKPFHRGYTHAVNILRPEKS